jgi:hypothetical protein
MAKFTNRTDPPHPEVEHRQSYENKKETAAWEASKEQPKKEKPASESNKQSK